MTRTGHMRCGRPRAAEVGGLTRLQRWPPPAGRRLQLHGAAAEAPDPRAGPLLPSPAGVCDDNVAACWRVAAPGPGVPRPTSACPALLALAPPRPVLRRWHSRLDGPEPAALLRAPAARSLRPAGAGRASTSTCCRQSTATRWRRPCSRAARCPSASSGAPGAACRLPAGGNAPCAAAAVGDAIVRANAAWFAGPPWPSARPPPAPPPPPAARRRTDKDGREVGWGGPSGQPYEAWYGEGQGWCDADQPRTLCPCRLEGLAGTLCSTVIEQVRRRRCGAAALLRAVHAGRRRARGCGGA